MTQVRPGPRSVLPRRCLNTVTKLGESTFAEVFNGIYNDARVAMKVVPFGGDIPVNGCPQTSMDDGTPATERAMNAHARVG